MSKSKLQVVWWAMYDWGNSSFTTLVVTFSYAVYFTKYMTTEDNTTLWTMGITATALTVALLSPILGAVADRRTLRKNFLAWTTAVCVVSTCALAFTGGNVIYLALGVFVLANVAFEMGMVFYNSFLPDLASPEKIGRISGFGWGAGYAGGLVCMAVAFVWKFDIRETLFLVAGWFLVFCLPFLVLVPETKRTVRDSGAAKSGLSSLAATFRKAWGYKQMIRFLAARLIFNDGLVTIFSMGGLYAALTFGMNQEQVLVFGLALNIAAGLGALAFGYLDDFLGARTTLLISLAALTVSTVTAAATGSLALFWAASIVIGICAGPNQSASRSLMGRFVPEREKAEFYGLFAFSGKFTSFLGPALFGIASKVTGTQRWGVAIIALFFVAGGIILLSVNEAEGQAAGRKTADIPA